MFLLQEAMVVIEGQVKNPPFIKTCGTFQPIKKFIPLRLKRNFNFSSNQDFSKFFSNRSVLYVSIFSLVTKKVTGISRMQLPVSAKLPNHVLHLSSASFDLFYNRWSSRIGTCTFNN